MCGFGLRASGGSRAQSLTKILRGCGNCSNSNTCKRAQKSLVRFAQGLLVEFFRCCKMFRCCSCRWSAQLKPSIRLQVGLPCKLHMGFHKLAHATLRNNVMLRHLGFRGFRAQRLELSMYHVCIHHIRIYV